MIADPNARQREWLRWQVRETQNMLKAALPPAMVGRLRHDLWSYQRHLTDLETEYRQLVATAQGTVRLLQSRLLNTDLGGSERDGLERRLREAQADLAALEAAP